MNEKSLITGKKVFLRNIGKDEKWIQDIIENDPNLLALSEDKFWSLYFNASRDAIKQRAQDIGQKYASCPSPGTLNGKTGFIWIEVDCDLQSQITVGTFLSPTIMVVDGDLTVRGGTFNGLVYVEGQLTTNANTRFNGLVVVEDDRPPAANSVDPGGGGADICVELGFFTGEKGIITGEAGLVPGTWRDWRVF